MATVAEVMRELGIELAGSKPRLLTRELAEQADVIVTMGCGDQCPYVPGKRYLDWDLPDPKGRPAAEVRATRDEIARRVETLLDALDSRDTVGRLGPANAADNPRGASGTDSADRA